MTEQLAAGDEDFVRPTPAGRDVAWDDPGTRRAWWRQTGRSLLLAATCAAWWTWYAGITIPVREGVVWLNVAFFLYSLFGLPLQLLAELPNAWRVRRVLRAHPWHIVENPPHGLSDHPKARDVSGAWFEVPDPADPERRVPLLIDPPLWWVRRMRADAPPERKAQVARLWYCGAPGDQVVIAASRAEERTPYRLRHRDLRNSVVPEDPARPDGMPVPDPAVKALSHPPTRRTMRRRLVNRAAAFAIVWGGVVTAQVAAFATGHENPGAVLFLGGLLELTLLPAHVCLIAFTFRTSGILGARPWRPVDIEVRRRGKRQLVHIRGRVLTPMMNAYVDDRATRLWIAGHPHERRVVSRPGGDRPITLAMSTADNRNP